MTLGKVKQEISWGFLFSPFSNWQARISHAAFCCPVNLTDCGSFFPDRFRVFLRGTQAVHGQTPAHTRMQGPVAPPFQSPLSYLGFQRKEVWLHKAKHYIAQPCYYMAKFPVERQKAEAQGIFAPHFHCKQQSMKRCNELCTAAAWEKC